MIISIGSVDSPYAQLLESHLADRDVDRLNNSATKCKKPGAIFTWISPISNQSSCQMELVWNREYLLRIMGRGPQAFSLPPQLPNFVQQLYGKDRDHVTKCIRLYGTHVIMLWPVRTQALIYLSNWWARLRAWMFSVPSYPWDACTCDFRVSGSCFRFCLLWELLNPCQPCDTVNIKDVLDYWQ